MRETVRRDFERLTRKDPAHALLIAVREGYIPQTRSLLRRGILPADVEQARKMITWALECEPCTSSRKEVELKRYGFVDPEIVKDSQIQSLKLLTSAIAEKWPSSRQAHSILTMAFREARECGYTELVDHVRPLLIQKPTAQQPRLRLVASA